jgi:hypothetical protein
MINNYQDLNNKKLYRLIKVLYVFFFLLISAISIFIIYDLNQYEVILNQEKTTVSCNYGNKKTFTLKELKINLTKEDFENFGKQPESRKKYFKEENPEEYIPDYKYNEIDYKKTEIKSWCNISEEENDKWIKAILAHTKDENLEKPKSSWDINPVYQEKGGLKVIIGLSLASLLIILITFEIIRRVFYYVVLGSFTIKNEKCKDIT